MGNTSPSLHGGHESRLFAAHKRARALHHTQVQAEVAVQNVLTQIARRFAPCESLPECCLPPAGTPREYTGCPRGRQWHRPRSPSPPTPCRGKAQQHSVHKCAGIALITVADKVFDIRLCRPHARPLHSRRKSGAAATAQSGPRNDIHDLVMPRASIVLDQALLSAENPSCRTYSSIASGVACPQCSIAMRCCRPAAGSAASRGASPWPAGAAASSDRPGPPGVSPDAALIQPSRADRIPAFRRPDRSRGGQCRRTIASASSGETRV